MNLGSRSQIFLFTKELEKNELQLPLVGTCPGVSRDGCLALVGAATHSVRLKPWGCSVVGDLFLGDH
jgi:hypothetical protein